jgi:regulator of sirC expression with transglutaminase-like and TPR domain
MIQVHTAKYYTSDLKRIDDEQKRKETHSMSYLIGLATKAVEDKDFESAIFYYSRVLEANPSDSLVLMQRAQIYIITEQYVDALADVHFCPLFRT